LKDYDLALTDIDVALILEPTNQEMVRLQAQLKTKKDEQFNKLRESMRREMSLE
jgi:hypothetical protein